jgi:hypothetical protein
MDHGCVSPGAVDLPRRRVELELGKRRHRRITGPSGVILFICLFLPAVKGCSEPVYPIAMPALIHPYVFGLVLAIGAASFTIRGMCATIRALRVLAWLTIAGSCLLAVLVPAIAIVELLLGFALLAAIGRHGYSERRVAITTILVGGLSLVWFGLWALSPDALVGVYLSTLGSAGLMVGGLVWLSETAYDSAHGWNQPHGIPRARGRVALR